MMPTSKIEIANGCHGGNFFLRPTNESRSVGSASIMSARALYGDEGEIVSALQSAPAYRVSKQKRIVPINRRVRSEGSENKAAASKK